MKFQFNKNKLWKYFLKSTFITFSIHLIGTFIFINYRNISNNELIEFIFLIVFFGWFFFFELPLLILFLNHFNLSKFTEFEMIGNSFSLNYEKKKINFELNDIKRIILNLSPPSYYNRIDFLYFGHFKYTTIELKNEIKINLSCLIIEKPEEIFSENKITRIKKIFPMIKKTLPNTV